MPRLRIDLRCGEAAANDPFFGRITRDHYRDARRRDPKRMFLRRMAHGVAVCPLPPTFDAYYMTVEGSARRNHKKAVREGCQFRPIVFNDHLAEIAEVRGSATHRQGKPMPAEYLTAAADPITDPPSRHPAHAYPYFGVFLNGKLIGYASCLIAGEYAGVETIFGHAGYFTYGVVPQLLIGIAEHLYRHHPGVKYYCYGTYFGATDTMRRFKRKFGFLPHRVDWALGTDATPTPLTPAAHEPRGKRMTVTLEVPDHLPYQLVYRTERAAPFEAAAAAPEGERFLFLHSGTDALKHFGTLKQRFGTAGAVKTVMKLFTKSRSLYLVTAGGRVVSDGWCTVGRCGYYKIEPDAVVVGPIWTSDECRGRGLATRALMLAMNDLHRRGTRVFYIDTAKTNTPAQKVFEKCGFGPPMALYIRDEGVSA